MVPTNDYNTELHVHTLYYQTQRELCPYKADMTFPLKLESDPTSPPGGRI